MIDKCDKAIGLDISDSSIKAVCLNASDKLESYGIEDLVPGSTDQDLVIAIKKVIDGQCRGCEINVGLRGTEVLTKILNLEAADSEELTVKVEEEIKSFLPVLREEVEVSWEVISVEDNQVKLLVIIIPKEVLLRYQRVIEGAGFAIKSFEINALTLKRSLGNKVLGKKMLIDVHAEEIDIELYRDNEVVVDRTIPFGGKKITQLLTHKLNINVEEAENYKRNNKVDEEQFLYAYKPFADDLISEIKRMLSMTELEYGVKPDKVLITGGDFAQEKLFQYLYKNLSADIEIELVKPEAVVDGAEIKEADKLRLCNAVGLALKQ